MNWGAGTGNNGNSVRWPDADWQHFCQGSDDWTIEFSINSELYSHVLVFV